jgi:hypothetical protein
MAGAGGKRSQAHNAFSGRANTIPAPVADQRAARAAGRAAPIAGPAAAGTGPKPAISFGSIPPFFQMMRNPYRALPCFLLTGLLLANFSKPAAAQPTITAVTPAANARAAAPAGPVTVGFSQPLLPSSAAALFVYSGQRGGLRSRGTTPAVVSGAELRFSPGPGGFAAGETVSTTIGAGVASSTGHLAAPRVVQFTTAAGGTGQGNFQPGADVGMGIHPLALAVGDIDGDGDPDLLTVSDYSYYSGVINIRLNDGTGSFGSPQSLPPTRAMQGLTLGDVDADGDLDLLTANYVEGSVSIRRNNGSGTFGPSQEVAVGQGVVQIVLADIDADGDLDLLALTYLNSGVSVRLNDGTGTFSGYDAVPVERYPVRMAVGDLDADGDLDLVTANSDSLFNTASVRLNNGQGSFAASQELRLGTSPSSVALGDIDGDGDLDLLASNRASGSVSVARNDGTGTFRSLQRVPVGREPNALTLGDVDGDGDLDFVTTNDYANTASVRYNDGQGSFSGGQALALPFNGGDVVLADVDADGDLDLLASHSRGNSVSVRFNQPPPAPGPGPAISRFAPDSAAAGTTVAVTGVNLGGLTAFSLHGTVVPLAAISGNTATGFRFVVPAGVPPTGTNTVTAAAGTASSPGFVVRLRIAGSRPAAGAGGAPAAGSAVAITFSEPVTPASAQQIRVYSAQAGGRKAGTVAVSGPTATFAATAGPYGQFRPGERVSVSVPAAVRSTAGARASRHVVQFMAAATGPGRGYFRPGTEAGVDDGPTGIALGDVDGDGDLDLVTANNGTYNTGTSVSVRLNGGDATGSNTGIFSGGSTVWVFGYAVALGDVDGDGDLDLLVTTRTSDVAVFLNGGDATGSNTGVFAPSPGPRILTFGGPVSIAVGDVDGDGDLDLLTADYFGYGVSVRLNGGDATGSNTGFFSRGSQVLVGFSPVCVTLGDVDGDGDLDLLSTSPGQGGSVVGNVSVRLNGGDASGSNTGAFSDGSTVPVGDTPRSVALGDVDGDGDLDLFTANSGDNTLSVRLNGGDATGSNTGLFSNGSEVPVGDEPRSVQAADVDADGDLDLLTVNRLGNTVSIRLNDGHGIFSGTREVAVGAQPRELALGDVDGDGDVDFVTANFGGSSASVRLNAATALASRAAAAAAPGLLLLPNPARGMVRATHLPAHQPVQVFDALGRLVLSATADAAGTATLNLPPGLPAGIYLVRGGGMAARLAVE